MRSFYKILICFLAVMAIGSNFAFAGSEFSLDCKANPKAYPWCGIKDIGGDSGVVNKLYNIGLAAVGAAALGAMIYGGILYTISTGNTSKQQDAMEWIWGAVLGIVLLLGAYLLFYTINPAILRLKIPDLQELKATSSTAYYESECTPQLNMQCVNLYDANKQYTVTPHCEVTLKDSNPVSNCCWKEKIGGNEVQKCSVN